MSRHGLVNGQVLYRVQVVLTQKRLHLFIGPVFRQRSDRIECFLPFVQGTRRAEIRERDTALELGHDDYLDRFLGHRDNVVLNDEVGRLLQVLPGDIDDTVPRREPAIGLLERGAGGQIAIE